MNPEKLCGSKVSIMISDPWDFGTECGIGPFWGIIIDTNNESLLVQLEKEIKYQRTDLQSAICTIRHERELKEGWSWYKEIPTNFILTERIACLSEHKEKQKIYSVGAIGSLKLVS